MTAVFGSGAHRGDRQTVVISGAKAKKSQDKSKSTPGLPCHECVDRGVSQGRLPGRGDAGAKSQRLAHPRRVEKAGAPAGDRTCTQAPAQG